MRVCPPRPRRYLCSTATGPWHSSIWVGKSSRWPPNTTATNIAVTEGNTLKTSGATKQSMISAGTWCGGFPRTGHETATRGHRSHLQRSWAARVPPRSTLEPENRRKPALLSISMQFGHRVDPGLLALLGSDRRRGVGQWVDATAGLRERDHL